MKIQRIMRLRRGFTLIELLASLAIVTVLATLLLSGGKTVWKKALDAKCLGNLKTLHGAMAVYAADSGHWPTLNRESINGTDEYGSNPWYEALLRQGYLPSRTIQRDGYDILYSDVLVCPANKMYKGQRMPWTASPYPWEPNYGLSQFWGDHWGTPSDPASGVDRLRLGSVNNSKAIHLIDSLIDSSIYPQWASWNSATPAVPRNLHGKSANAVLVDGSAVTVSPENYPDLEEDKYWNPRYVAP